jgi:HPt (histidine-containing phosphotransfer) domain-containing protein
MTTPKSKDVQPAAARPVDLTELANMTGVNDPVLIGKILKALTKTTASLLETLKEAVNQKNFSKIKKAIHGMKGAALQAAATDLKNLISGIEMAVQKGSLREVQKFVDNIEQEYKRLDGFVKEYLGEN